jgi:hypothetical protein
MYLKQQETNQKGKLFGKFPPVFNLFRTNNPDLD